jgi:hypothetical protein
MGEKKFVIFNKRRYEVVEKPDEFELIDKSDEQIKFDISFSKDPIDNKKARDGLTIFFTEIFS